MPNLSRAAVPVIRFDHIRAEKAFRLHQALLRCLREDPALADDELFQIFREEAFERFERAFKVQL